MARAIASTVSAVLRALGGQRRDRLRIAVVDDHLVAVAKQPPGDVAAHAPPRRQAELHQDASFTVMSETSEITAVVMSAVFAVPPRSGVCTPLAVTFSIAFMSRAADCASPRCSSIIAAVQKVAIGLPRPCR
jgi:hypothetical protein